MNGKELMIELLEITDIQEDSTVVFSDRAVEIIKELSGMYEQTPIYKENVEKMPDWIKNATAAEVYYHMCDKITKAPTGLHVMMVGPILIPILWQKLQEAEQKLKETEVAAEQGAGEKGLAYATI